MQCDRRPLNREGFGGGAKRKQYRRLGEPRTLTPSVAQRQATPHRALGSAWRPRAHVFDATTARQRRPKEQRPSPTSKDSTTEHATGYSRTPKWSRTRGRRGGERRTPSQTRGQAGAPAGRASRPGRIAESTNEHRDVRRRRGTEAQQAQCRCRRGALPPMNRRRPAYKWWRTRGRRTGATATSRPSRCCRVRLPLSCSKVQIERRGMAVWN